MEKRSEQQRLNLDIAYELDKYQVMLEYGRLFLDRDKSIRDKYRWMSFAKIGCLSGTAIEFLFTVLTAFLSVETLTKWWPYILAVLLLSLILYVVFMFAHRKAISKLVSKDNKDELEVLLDNLQKYLCQLGEWIKSVDSHIKQTKEVVVEIKGALAVAKSKQADDVNRLSHIFGTLDETMDAKAHELANARLQQYKQYIYADE